jgi:uncharacterized damage-inducible protein DinB
MALGISFEELLRYEEEQLEQWRSFFRKRPHLLNLDASPNDTLGDILFHTFTVELRSAQRLLGEPMTPDSQLQRQSIDDLFAIAANAHQKLRRFLATASPQSIEQLRTFPSATLGEFTATSKKLLLHAIIHAVRHWAQVARILRENGQPTDFSHDVLFSKALH